MARLLFAAALLLAGSLPGAAFAGAPKVVTSILPLQSLAANVMRGLGEPALLVRGAATPHSFALRPSDAAALQETDLVIWVGEGFETFLEAPLSTLPGEAKILELSNVEGVTLLPPREEAIWAAHDHSALEHEHDEGHGHDEEHDHEEDHGHDDGHGHDHGHSHGVFDPHIWLDPVNAMAMVEAIAAALVELDPANAAAYRTNAEDTVAKLRRLDKELQAELAPVADESYLVFHDAYQYFEARYGLSPLGAVSLAPERTPGARHLAEIRERLQAEGVVCVFSEPQFEPKLLEVVTEGTTARGAPLDPLGANLTPGPEAYFSLMQDMAESLTACLGGNG